MSVNFDSILNDFINESNELLDRAETDLLTMEQGGFSDELVNGIFRAVHTIKGNAGLFELNRISSLAHSLESALNLVRNKQLAVSMEIIDIALSSIDRLREMIRNVTESESVSVDDLLEKLKTVMNPGSPAEKKQEPAPVVVQPKPNPVRVQVIAEPGEYEKKPSVPLKNGKFAIPTRFVNEAREKNSFLCLISLDLADAGSRTLTEIKAAFRQLEISGYRIVAQGIREDKIKPSDAASLVEFPYYIVTESRKVPDESWKPFEGWNPVIKVLFSPGEGQDAASPLTDEKEPVREEEIMSETVTEIIPAEETTPAVPEAEAPVKSDDLKNAKHEAGETHLKVPIKLIDTLINLAGEAVIARNEMMQRIAETRDVGMESLTKRMSFLITRIQEGIMRTRLQELNTVFQKIPRIVRDAAQSTSKKVDLIVDGGEVELDKALIDAIGESMMHMIRNSVDHGIEPPEERIKAGKKEAGLLKVQASLRGGNVVLTIRDDGRGLDLDRIRNKAVAGGHITKEAAAGMSNDEIAELVFLPGLSTAEKVTKTSGRGVGMDVVRSHLKKVGGSVDITTEKGKGTTITATLPQTLSIVTCLMIRSNQQLFALPQQNVVELILLDTDQLKAVEGHEVYELRGHLLPLLHLGRVLNLDEKAAGTTSHIVVVKSERHHFGLMIDEVVNLEEIVVKRLGEHFAGLSFFSGAAIMGDGESVLILDVPGLARFTNLQANAGDDYLDEDMKRSLEGVETGHLLFSVHGQQFGVNVSTVPRIEKIDANDIEIFMGIEVIRYRGEVVPVVRLEEVYELDIDVKDKQEFYVIIFNTDGMRTGIVASEINNVVDQLPPMDDHTFSGDSVKGHVIIGENVTLIIDAIELLKNLQSGRFRDIAKHLRNGGSPVADQKPEKQKIPVKA